MPIIKFKGLSANLFAACVLAFFNHTASATEYLVVPDNQTPNANQLHFSAAIDKAIAGDTIKLSAGEYQLSLGMSLKGTFAKPITLLGAGEATLIQAASAKAGYCFAFKDSQHLTIKNLKFEGCGAVAVALIDSHYISFEGLAFIGGRYPVLAKGDNSHHLLLDSVSWNQDPSGDVYWRIPWATSHHGEMKHLNGSLVFAKGIAGNIIVRNSLIQNAFNGIRMKGDSKKPGATNANIEIYNNRFINIRDNPIEPEVDATNWWVYRNHIVNAHGYFSFTEVSGGHWYVFRNIGITTAKPKGEHSKGKILKFEDKGPLPSGPFMVFNNSWYGDKPVFNGGESRNLHYQNNAHYFTQTMAPLPLKLIHSSYNISHNIFNQPTGSAALDKANVIDRQFAFADKEQLHNRAKLGLDAGTPIQIDDYAIKYSGSAPDIGAYEQGGEADIPPFKSFPITAEDAPRLVKIESQHPNHLKLWTSIALKPATGLTARLIFADGTQAIVPIKIQGRSIELEVDNKKLKQIQLPKIYGVNQQPLTSWAQVKADFGIEVD